MAKTSAIQRNLKRIRMSKNLKIKEINWEKLLKTKNYL